MWRSNLRRAAKSLTGDTHGALAVEFGIVGSMFIVMLMGIMEFGSAFWQWNQATKALQLGVRLAAVSDPVSSDLKTMTGLSSTVVDGDPMPYYQRVCGGATSSCTNGTFDLGALQTIVYGRGNTSCPTQAQAFPPMCQIFPRVRPANVVVEYVHTGLGYAGRPGGPVPTIKLSLTGLNFDFIILNRLIGLPQISMSSLMATATGEDLSGR